MVFTPVFLIVIAVATTTQALENETSSYDIKNCLKTKSLNSTVECFAVKMLTQLDEVARQKEINVMSGVVLSSDAPIMQRSAKQLQVIQLSPTTEEKMTKLLDMMLDVMSNMFAGRTLKINLPKDPSNTLKRAFDEGRGKMKKYMGPLMMAIGAKLFAVVPIMLGGLALLASKALIVSKLALALTLIVGAQYLFMNGGGNLLGKFGQGGFGGIGSYGGQTAHSYSSYGVPTWNAGASQSFPYARALNNVQPSSQ